MGLGWGWILLCGWLSSTCACILAKFGANCQYDDCTANCPSAALPGLAAQYFTNDGFNQLTPLYTSYDRVVDFNWGGGGPKPGISGDYFRVIWTGFIYPDQSGNYTLRCQTNGDSETCRFWVSGAEATSQQPMLLTNAVAVRLKIVYEDYWGGAAASLQWTTPNNTMFTPIPADYFMRQANCTTCSGQGACVADEVCRCNPGYTGFDCSISVPGFVGLSSGGLRASYACCDNSVTSLFFNPTSFNSTEIVPNIDVSWGGGAPGGLYGDFFMVRYEGFLQPPTTGWYTLQATTNGDDEGVRIFVDKVLVFNWAGGFSQDVHLRQGVNHELLVEYNDRWGGAQVHLNWATPQNSAFVSVPSANLMYYTSAVTAACPINSDNGLTCSGPLSSLGCYNGACQCLGGYYGTDCSLNTCANDKCLNTDMCHHASLGSTEGSCGGQGLCKDGVCVCVGNLTSSTQCTIANGCPGDSLCSSGGTCSNFNCVCSNSHYGMDCQYDVCNPRLAYLPGLTAEYQTNAGFNIPVAQYRSAVRNIDFDWGGAGPRPEVSGDFFRVIWTGFVRPYATGNYTFRCTTNNDDEWCRMWIAGNETSGPMLLTQNVNVRIKIVYYDTWGGAQAHFQWLLPGAMDFVVVPEESLVREVFCPSNCSNNGCCVGEGVCLCKAGFTGADCSQNMNTCDLTGSATPVVGGLRAAYAGGGTSVTSLFFTPSAQRNSAVVPMVDFAWGGGAPAGLPGDFFMARYEGYLRSNYTGWHTLYVTTNGDDEGARVFIDKVPLFGWSTSTSGDVYLLAGVYHEIVIEYNDRWGGAQVHLYWSSFAFNTRLIQATDLFYRDSNATCACPINPNPLNNLTCSGPVNSFGCYNGMCQCRGGYYGADCSQNTCPNEACMLTDSCHHAFSGSSEGVCGGNGNCNNGVCDCFANFTSASQCTVPTSCPGNGLCSSVGTCNTRNACTCDAAHFGSDCQFDVCRQTLAYAPGLTAEFYSNDGFNQYSKVYRSSDRAVDFAWGGGGPKPGISGDFFKAVWTGYVRPFVSGNHSFRCTTNNDDEYCRMWVGGTEVVEATQVLLNQNTNVRIKIIYQDTWGGAQAHLQWLTPQSTWTVVPDEQLVREVACPLGCNNQGCCVAEGVCRCNPGFSGPDCSVSTCSGSSAVAVAGGLRATYHCCDNSVRSLFFNRSISVLTEIVRTVDVGWGGGAPMGLGGDFFMVRYEGYISPTTTDWYTIQVTTNGDDEAARVFVDKSLVFGWTTSFSQAVHLRAGVRHEFVVEYYDTWGGAGIHVYWSSSSFVSQIIPATNLFYTSNASVCSCPVNPDPLNNIVCSGPLNSLGCHNGYCQCVAPFYGPDCSLQSCLSNDVCLMNDMCHHEGRGSSDGVCGGNGQCNDGVCACEGNFTTYSQCSRVDGCPGDGKCSNSGTCGMGGFCACNAGFTGIDCQYTQCGGPLAYLPGLTSEYYTNDGFGHPIQYLRSFDHVLDTYWGGAGPRPTVSGDWFRIVWTGFVRPYQSGNFSFRCTTNGDDEWCRVWVNGTERVSSDVLVLTQNTNVRIKIIYEDHWGGAAIHLQWLLPNASTFVTVPEESLVREAYCPSGCSGNGCCVGDGVCRCKPGFTGSDCSISMIYSCGLTGSTIPIAGGLRATYSCCDYTATALAFNPKSFNATEIVSRIDLNWGGSGPAVGMSGDGFMARFEGFIRSNVSGWHTFYVTTNNDDEGARLFIDKVQVFGWAGAASGDFYLVSGTYHEITMEYYDTWGGAQIHLSWSSPGFVAQIVPNDALYSLSVNARCDCPRNPHPLNAMTCSGPLQSLGCFNGVCQCLANFYGADCSLNSCANDACLMHDSCHHPLMGSSDGSCGGNGQCNNGVCQCIGNYTPFSQCTVMDGCPGNGLCGGKGVCSSSGNCICGAGSHGPDCQYIVCNQTGGRVPGLDVAYYYNQSFLFTGVDANVDVSWGGAGPLPSVPGNNFQVVWSGYLQVNKTGTYYFDCSTNNDDEQCEVTINGVRAMNRAQGFSIIANDWISVQISYADYWGNAQCHFLMQSPSSSVFAVVPSHQLSRIISCPAGCKGRGCCTENGRCRCNPGWTGVDCSQQVTCNSSSLSLQAGGFAQLIWPNASVPFNAAPLAAYRWSAVIDDYFGNAAPLISTNTWSTQYYAWVTSDHTAWHQFGLSTNNDDEGARLWVDGYLVWDFSANYRKSVFLIKGQKYAITVEYYNTWGNSQLHLWWSSPYFANQIVPQRVTSYLTPLGGCGCPVGNNGLICNGENFSFGCYQGFCRCRAGFNGTSCDSIALPPFNPVTDTFAPTTQSPTYAPPTPLGPTSYVPTNQPSTGFPTTARPTSTPSSLAPSSAPTQPTLPPTSEPTSLFPTGVPSFVSVPTTKAPTLLTNAPATAAPTVLTSTPTTAVPTSPTTTAPTPFPSTHVPTGSPTTAVPTPPTTLAPSFSPTTGAPSSSPTTRAPTVPTTGAPSSAPSPTLLPGTVESLEMLCDGVRLDTSNLAVSSCSVDPLLPMKGSIDISTGSKKPQSYIVISPVVDLDALQIADSNGSYVFTIPYSAVLRDVFVKQAKETTGCADPKLECQWLDPNTRTWQNSGCALIADQNGKATCNCSHLTVFAMVMRSELHLEPMCHATDTDYALLGCYAVALLICMVQLGRLIWIRKSGAISTSSSGKAIVPLLVQHALLLAACILRIVFIVLKPVMSEPDTLPVLVLLGLLPSAAVLSIFLYMSATWLAIRVFSMESSPFAKLRIPFAAIVVLYNLLMLAICIGVGVTQGTSFLEIGSYILCALTAVAGACILGMGIALVRMLRASASKVGTKQVSTSRRFLIATLALSAALFLQAACWVASINNVIMDSSAQTLAVSVAFYFFDLVALLGVVILMAPAIRKMSREVRTISGRSDGSSRGNSTRDSKRTSSFASSRTSTRSMMELSS